MCGRYSLALTVDKFQEYSGFELPWGAIWETRYNIAPSQSAPVLTCQNDQLCLQMAVWGFRPKWLKNSASVPPPINARAESLVGKPTFKEAFMRGRALVPATSFFEWSSSEERGRKRIPYCIQLKQMPAFFFAALWEQETFCVVTVEAGAGLQKLHHRMPAILTGDEARAWLREDDKAAHGLITKAVARREFSIQEVSSLVNSTTNEGPQLLEQPRQLKLL